MEDAARRPESRSAHESQGRSDRWLFGRTADLLLGCGLGYVALTALLLLPGATQALAPRFVFVSAVIGLVTNTPHYGATLLRVYEHRRDRRRYALFAVHATLLIFALFVGGIYWAGLGSLLLTIYITWSPWHFSGQNYGLALMFLRRRGVSVDARTKRLLYLSFVLSFVIAFFALHGGTGRLQLAPVPQEQAANYRFLALGIPDSIWRPALWIGGSSYALVLIAVATSLLRRARAIDLVPSAMLVLLQAAWFSIPALLVLGREASGRQLAFSVFWISIAHSIQYLWVSRYYARQTGGGSGGIYLGKTLLAGAGVTMLPALLFAPGLLGTVPFDAGMGVLLFAVVNIHHFLLDGAIWKLRDGPVARALLRAEPPVAEPIAPERWRWRPLVWAACAVAVSIYVLDAWELEFGVRRAHDRGDLARVERAIQHLRWIGRESHAVHHNQGLLLAQGGRLDAARAHLERSVELYPTANTWTALGNLERVQRRYPEALAALDTAIRLDPGYEMAHKRRGEVLAETGDLEHALEALREAQRLAPDHPGIRDSLQRVEQQRGGRSAE